MCYIFVYFSCLPLSPSFTGTICLERIREFPGGPVVRTRPFHCRGLGSIPGQGTEIPQATRRKYTHTHTHTYVYIYIYI